MKKLAALVAALFLLAACGQSAPGAPSSESEPETPGGSTHRAAVASEELQFQHSGSTDTTVVMETTAGTIRFVLYPRLAPLAVENFCTLARQGYYNGSTFHRIVKDFIVQAGLPGQPVADESGVVPAPLAEDSIWGGAFLTERSSRLHHYSGALCMAATGAGSNTHLSQFYIVATPQGGLDETALMKLREAGYSEAVVDAYRQAGGAPYLDNGDTVFGQVISGMDVADQIAGIAVREDGTPRKVITITAITVQNYPPPGLLDEPAPQPEPEPEPEPTSDISSDVSSSV